MSVEYDEDMDRLGMFAPNEYYHLLARGNYKQAIFFDEDDYIRFLFLILYQQSARPIQHISRKAGIFKDQLNNNFGQHPMLTKIEQQMQSKRLVEVVNFCLMPNHFHLTVKENEEGGTSKYMQKTLNSFTKYHNTKYEKKGHLFEGPFKAVHIETDVQLLYLSAYIHRNPQELRKWKDKELLFPWSSYQDYVKENRWGNLLIPNIVRDRYKDGDSYINMVNESGAKDDAWLELEKTFPEKWFE